jgi:pilus assembly protein CpaF
MSYNIESLFQDSKIEDIVLNPQGVIFFKSQKWQGPHECTISNNKEQLWELARKIAESASLTLGLTQPCVDSILTWDADIHFRAHVVIPPMVLHGPTITLRRLPKLSRYHLGDFCNTENQQKALISSLINKESILVAGATGSGKSTLLTTMMEYLGGELRFIILEDSPELPIPNALSNKLLARPNRYGFRQGATWDLSQLVYESLRMRPERLVLGECRGPEALALAHALHTGHRGLMTTLHAGTVEEAKNRFCELASQQSDFSLEQLSHVWDCILVVENHSEGERRLREFWHKTKGFIQ